jgi:hypothetical protein
MEALETAAADGPVGERELFRRARAHAWGPGRAHRALRAAQREGRLIRRGRTYVAAERSGTSS